MTSEMIEGAQSFDGIGPMLGGATVRIVLPQTNVVLSLAVEPEERANDRAGASMPFAQQSIASDPILGQLLGELRQANRVPDDVGTTRSDAIRLAVLARWLGLHARSIAGTRDSATATFQKWRLNRVLAYIEENIAAPITLTDLSRAAGISRMYCAAQFRAATGIRPREYILRRRVEHAKSLLAKTNDTLAKVAGDVGFRTQAHFTTVFKRYSGTTPGQWRLSQRNGF